MEQKTIWLDGTLVPWEQATVHVMTHTLYYGSGAFEGIRCYATEHGPAIFRLSDHVDRLIHSFSFFNTPLPWSKEVIEQGIIDVIHANNLTNCYIRPMLFFRSKSLLLSPKRLSIHCTRIALDIEKYLGREAITVGLSSIKRIDPESMPLHNKINGSYANSIFAFHEAQEKGFDKALLLDHKETIAEESVANISFVIDGVLKTPPQQSILPNITRASIIAIAQSLDLSTTQETLTLHDITKATEDFFTGTASEITSIKSIEHTQFVTPGAITKKLKKTYHAAIYGKNNRFKPWLTFIHQ